MSVYGEKENPCEYHQQELSSPKVNVWCALLHNIFVGPLFFTEETVKQNSYMAMLEGFILPDLRYIPNLIFQQDGALPQWVLRMQALLDTEFLDQWIGRGGPVP